MTFGSATKLSNSSKTPGLVAHEFGHTLQFIGLSALSGAAGGRSMENLWGAYSLIGIVGITSYGSWWEGMADVFGGVH